MITYQEILDLSLNFPAQGRENTLYGLADHAGLPGLCSQLEKTQTRWSSLFQGSKDEGALEVAPILFAIEVRRSSFARDALLKWICQRGANSSSLIFMASPLAMEDLSRRLALRLDAQLPENVDVVLRFFDTRIFESVLTVLTEEQKRQFLTPACSWWYMDRKDNLQHVESFFSAEDGHSIPLLLTVPQERLLLDASEPDQVAQLLRTYIPFEFGKLIPGQTYDFLTMHMRSAREFGIISTHDHALYCSLALLEGDDFSVQAKWAAALTKFKIGNFSLSELFELVDIQDEET